MTAFAYGICLNLSSNSVRFVIESVIFSPTICIYAELNADVEILLLLLNLGLMSNVTAKEYSETNAEILVKTCFRALPFNYFN